MLRKSFVNVGSLDRSLRALLGAALIAIAVTVPGMTWAWIGVLPLLTAAIGWCPLYSLLGISTCPKPPKEAR
jgi:hypothetical protein